MQKCVTDTSIWVKFISKNSNTLAIELSGSICKQIAKCFISEILMDSVVNQYIFIQISFHGYVKYSLVVFYCKFFYKTISE